MLLALAPAVAHADGTPSKAACVEAYKSSQELSRSGALNRALSLALVCARDPCPAVLRKDCADWVADIEQRLPSLLFVLHDEDGRDIATARVLVDGTEVAQRLGGRPIDVDPGEHSIQIVVEGRPALERTIIAREREKAREVLFAFEPSRAAPPTAPPPSRDLGVHEAGRSRRLPWTFWAAAGASGIGLTGFGIFGVSGLNLRSDLDQCKPDCPQDRIDHGRTSFLVADVFLATAVVAAGVATVIYLTH
jgi:hypothetical protein